MRLQPCPTVVAQDPCLPAPVLPACPSPPRLGGLRETRQLLELLKSLLGKEVLIQAGSLVRKGKLISVDPVLLVSPEGKVCFLRLDAIQAVDF